VPSSATSVKFTIDSVNGTAYSGTPTTETLSAANSACQSVGGQLSCLFNLPAPVGAVILTVTIYNGTTVIGEGNLAVTTTNGGTVSAPVTLTGTVNKIVLSVGTGVEGTSGSIPVTVQAEDANGNTILGNYGSPLTVTDTDASGQTSIATSGSDSPPSGELISSSDTATLTYKGGVMSAAATIGASAVGVSASNVMTASFLPNNTVPTVNGATATFAYSQSWLYGTNAPPSGTPSTNSGTYTVTVATGQSFNGVSNLVEISGLAGGEYFAPTLGSPVNMCSNCDSYFGEVGPGAYALDESFVSYFLWNSTSSTASLGLVGVSDPTADAQLTCASPYSQQVVVPFPASWNVLSGAGTCSYSSQVPYGGGLGNDASVFNADGSYSDSYTISCCGGAYLTYAFSTQSSGMASMMYSDDFGDNGYILSVPAVTSTASTIPITIQTFPNEEIPPAGTPSTPAPVATTVPNPWTVAAGLTAAPPSPLDSDTFVSKGTISTSSLPSQCQIGAGVIPSGSTLTEADETIVQADPLADWNPLYTTETIRHFYLAGVGEICNGETGNYLYLDESALAWYSGSNQGWSTSSFTQWVYVTSASLQAALARRGTTAALSATAAGFQAASYLANRSAMHMRPPSHTFVNHFTRRT
jgi:hypothetical protein